MNSIWNNLIQSWQLQGLPIQNACGESEISSFETEHMIALPSEVRTYLLNVNGMNPHWPGDHDQEGFTFWPLERIRTLAEEIERQNKFSWSVAEPDSYILFCDYMTWCWAYAIKIDRQTSDVEGIYLVCCSDPLKIANTFTEFARQYLEKSDKLYPPSDHEHI